VVPVDGRDDVRGTARRSSLTIQPYSIVAGQYGKPVESVQYENFIGLVSYVTLLPGTTVSYGTCENIIILLGTLLVSRARERCREDDEAFYRRFRRHGKVPNVNDTPYVTRTTVAYQKHLSNLGCTIGWFGIIGSLFKE
jgi:hypothetical protein